MLSGKHPRGVQSHLAVWRDLQAEAPMGNLQLLAELLRDLELSPPWR